MSLSLKESLARDDPAKYFYKVQILEEDKGHKDGSVEDGQSSSHVSSGRRESGRMKEKNIEKLNGHTVEVDSKTKWAGSLMEVQCNVMS